MRVALIHYWLVNMRGGEKVLEALCEMFPEADIFTHVLDPAALSPVLRSHKIQTTFIQHLPGATKHYQKYLPLMPMALEQLDLREYDLVISGESGPAKGVVTSPGSLHVCYCHTPMRYVWDMYYDYTRERGPLMRAVMAPLIHYLKMWDVTSAARVDYFTANSAHVARRIAKFYRREADVIYPPVNVDDFRIGVVDDFYLMVGQLVGYKRADVAVRAFNEMGKRLLVIGEGEQLESLRRIARPNVSLLGRQPFEVIRDHYSRCKALIFPGEEDFGIVPVEAMASGRPVIAFARGGALETVKDGVTGLFFSEQSPEALMAAVGKFENDIGSFDSSSIRMHAQSFSKAMFHSRFGAMLAALGVTRDSRRAWVFG